MDPISNFLKIQKKSWERVITDGQQLERDLASSKQAESRAKEKYYKTAETAKTNDKTGKKTEEANIDYVKRVSQLKAMQKKYFEDIPNILTELQKKDEELMKETRSVIDVYSDCFTPSMIFVGRYSDHLFLISGTTLDGSNNYYEKKIRVLGL